MTTSGFLDIRILKSKLGTVDSAGFEAYLQANDVEFLYELETPITTEKPELDNIMAFSDGDMLQLDMPVTIKYVTALNKDSAFINNLKTTEQLTEQMAEVYRILAANALTE